MGNTGFFTGLHEGFGCSRRGPSLGFRVLFVGDCERPRSGDLVSAATAQPTTLVRTQQGLGFQSSEHRRASEASAAGSLWAARSPNVDVMQVSQKPCNLFTALATGSDLCVRTLKPKPETLNPSLNP